MSTLQAIPTQYGIDILNSELKSTVTRYQLVGALIHDAPSESLYTFHEDTIETSYYDENGVLTFIINLPIEQHFDEYLHRIDVLDANDQTVIKCETPKIALPKGIGGMVTLKAAITGEPGDVVFKHGEYMTETELVEVHLLKYSQSSVTQFLPYDPNRIYQCGEVCYTVTDGKVSYWEWYSNVESLAGKDPLDTANRRVGWSDNTKPFYWKPYTAKVPGETMAWDTDSIPENMVVGIGQQLPVAVYHSLASAKPEWIDDVDNTLINIPDRQGRFVRAANGNDWLAGETHEDAIREISGALHTTTGFNPSSATGAFSYDTDTPVASAAGIAVNSTTTRSIDFLASNVVPTASEVQPKAYIEWVGYAL